MAGATTGHASVSAAEDLLRDAGTNAVLVGLSGGKDSLVTLDLCTRVFPRVEAFYMYFVEGLRCVEDGIDRAAARYGIKVHRVPHWDLGQLIKNAVFRPHLRAAYDWRNTKLGHIEQHVRQHSGIDWIAYGHRMTESLERRGMLHKLNGIDPKARRVYPLWDWATRDVFAYMRARRIPLPPDFNKKSVSGVDLRLETLEYLRDNYPDDLARVLKVFPFAGAQFMRKEYRGGDAK